MAAVKKPTLLDAQNDTTPPPGVVSAEDRLLLALAAEQARSATLALQLAAATRDSAEAALNRERERIRGVYALSDTDSIDLATGAITRR